MRLSEVAQVLGLERTGDDLDVVQVKVLEQAREGDLSFVVDAQWVDKIGAVKAVIVTPDLVDRLGREISCLLSAHPALDAARAAMILGQVPFGSTFGIHPQAVISPEARLDEGVSVGAGAYIGPHVTIGRDTRICPGAVILDGTVIGERCVIQANAVLGSDGFGYEPVDGKSVKVPHFGRVRLGDDVEIGACTTVDRARFGETVIGSGTKIDNLVQIAHNVQVGRGCILVAQVGIAGSSQIEDYVVLAGQAGVVPHVTIGKGARIAASTGVAEDVPPGATWSGWMGQNHRDNMIQISMLRKLPEFMKLVRAFMKGGRG